MSLNFTFKPLDLTQAYNDTDKVLLPLHAEMKQDLSECRNHRDYETFLYRLKLRTDGYDKLLVRPTTKQKLQNLAETARLRHNKLPRREALKDYITPEEMATWTIRDEDWR